MTELFGTWPGEAPVRVGLACERVDWQTPDEVWTALEAWRDAVGWVARPHTVEDWREVARSGSILAAELARDGQSLHVRRTSEGWSGWTYTEGADGDVLRFTEQLLGTHPDGERQLVYAVYWAKVSEPDGVMVYRPFTARFAGWETR